MTLIYLLIILYRADDADLFARYIVYNICHTICHFTPMYSFRRLLYTEHTPNFLMIDMYICICLCDRK